MISLNYRDSRPIYEQVKDGLRRLIVSGVLAPGDKLPSVRSMASDLAINPNTIQKAYNELEAEGVVISMPGKGSFVPDRPVVSEERKAALFQQLEDAAAQLRWLGVSDAELIARVKEEGAK